ncbi:RNA polymerase II-associated factor 1-like protein [Chlorella sorokiniana]|uniref:RNA polymerase II-associated factor 1-like protein n=1 Tax=Chlorella sorokiniana TaxID=3076 RepID=A0A2P6TGJ9_CHLSO|nr:RNA polymerase II-associated factor 1-like protein [Chlorella sorokiniana]|eukprot:PRW33241.1 RNA polymerase II-associated factor 1-like protein [Chlorella sorokiniana]
MAEQGKEKKRGPEWNVHISSAPNRLRRETAFMCNIRFRNDLPEIPCDPKLLLPPFNKEELAAFKLTELEKDLQKDLLFEADLGIPIHAWNIEQYSIPEGPPQPLHPDDAAILAADEEASAKEARLRGEAGEVSWLMRTKYIAAEAGLKRSAGPAKQEAHPGEEENEDPREARIRQIEAQFAAARAPPVHCKDPSLRPLEILPVFPDGMMEGRSSVLVSFDNDPLQDVDHVERLPPEERTRMRQAAQLKSFKPASGKQFVALLVPPRPPQEGDVAADSGNYPGGLFAQDYQWVREYNTSIRVDDKGTTFLFRFAGDSVQFHDLNMQLQLRKRKRGVGVGEDEDEEESFNQPEKIIIRLPGTYDPEAEAAAEEEAARQRQRQRQRRQDGSSEEQQQQPEWGEDDDGGAAAADGGGSEGEAAAGAADGGGGRGEDEWGGRVDANATLRDVFGDDDDDI